MLDSSYGEVHNSPHRHSLRLVNRWLENIPDRHVDYYAGSSLYYSLPRNSAAPGAMSPTSSEAAGIHVVSRKPLPAEWMTPSDGYRSEHSPEMRGAAAQSQNHQAQGPKRHSPNHQNNPSAHQMGNSEMHKEHYPNPQLRKDSADRFVHGDKSDWHQRTSPHHPQMQLPHQSNLQSRQTPESSPHHHPPTNRLALSQPPFGYTANTPLQQRPLSHPPKTVTPEYKPPAQQGSPPGEYANLNSTGGSLKRKAPQTDVEDLYAKPHRNRGSQHPYPTTPNPSSNQHTNPSSSQYTHTPINLQNNPPDLIRNTTHSGSGRSQDSDPHGADRRPPVAPKPSRVPIDKHILVFPERYDLKPSVV